MLGAALAVLFGLWLVASIPNQFRWRWWETVARRDALGLLPRWTFFAPRPGQHDLHLIFRDRSPVDDAITGPWRQVEFATMPWWLRVVWNPSRFARKAVTDVGGALVRAATRAGRSGESPAVVAAMIQLNPAYLRVLGWVLAQPGDEGGDARQFALVRTQTDDADRRLEPVFVSFIHPRP
ncbi:hypothetical protein [Microbacterium sp.]|jgi:hypothetical protein|uniref:hypothetical protein n=1 Tax=Microbacterium sp. TaxID=51671 RepID=UPI0025D4BB78|nr:hypothetical protein [Microbacterium sp.]